MKKTNKLISWLLTGAMAFSSIGAVSMVSAEEEVKKGVRFSEGFEEWEVGVLGDTAGSYTVGNLKFNLLENDKLEIAVNEYGNKALKITKGNTTTSTNTIRYIFPEQYSGDVEVSFDFLSEHNSRNFSQFGTLEFNKNPNTIHNFTHYKNDLYVGGIQVNYLANAFSSKANKGYVKFTEKYNTVGNTDKLVYLGYDRNRDINVSTSGVDSKMYSIPSTTAATNVIEKIHAIRWSLRSHSWNGADTAVSEGDTINAAVYWIDNIVVETDTPYVSDSNTVVEEDFEGYSGTIAYNGGVKNLCGYMTLNMPSGDTAAITTDSVTGSKALKFVKGKSESLSYLDFSLGDIADKLVKLSFDVRFENHSRYLRQFPAIMDSSNATVVQTVAYRDNMYWNAVGNAGVYLAKSARSADKKDEYTKFEYTIDPSAGKAYADIQSSSVTLNTTVYNISKTSVKTLRFNIANAVSGGVNNSFVSHMGLDIADTEVNPDNNGIYWIDNVRFEIVTLNLESTSIKDGDTDVSTAKNLTLNFNQPVADNVADAILITKNGDMIGFETEYTVTLSEDAKSVTIAPVDGNWDYESEYDVLISEVRGQANIVPYEGTSISFTTGEYSNILLSDNFENLKVGQKWTGPGTFAYGNITLRLSEGDSVEYAYDESEKEYGLKLIKSNTDGDLDFIYSFPGGFTDGKYMVKVDERIQNHSKGHRRWPAMLSGAVSGEIQRMGLRAASFWLQQTGSLGVDRYGVDHSSNKTSRYIATATGNKRTVVFGELSTEAGIKYGLYDPSTDSYTSSLEPATDVATLGGVLMRMTSGEMEINESFKQAYECGTQVDEDTVNNPDNFGIAWIYGVTVEKVTLGISQTSFESEASEFNPANPLTITFNQKLDVNYVNTDNIELYENGNKISSYDCSINLSEDKKTVTINHTSGMKFGTEYTIVVKKDLKAEDSQVAGMYNNKTYTVKTAEYQDTNAPDITWTTIPNGYDKIDASAETEMILSTNGVFIAENTITKDNIKVYENGVEFTDYTVEKEGFFAIKVKFGELKKNAEYKIAVSGLLSGGENNIPMTEVYETVFKTEADIYVDDVVSTISADGTKSVITAELFNKTEADVNYQVIGVLKGADEKILAVSDGTSGTVTAGGVADIKVENDVNADAVSYDLYIWDGLGTMKPLVKKSVLNAVNKRTYGYDNYIDSSKPLKVSYIGGSITQQRQYTTPLTSKLSTLFKKDNAERTVNYSVQGIGGTNSTLGLYRLEKDVASYKPDLVFIEFAVNDTDTASANRVKSMEGIIRKLIELEHQPMVVLLDLTTSSYASLDVIADWEPLMQAYGIGYVNVAQYIKDNEATAEKSDGLYVWREADLETYPKATAITGTDGVHPTAAGGQIYADYMYDVITKNPEKFFKKLTYVETPVSGHEYGKATMTPWTDAVYDDNWTKVNDLSWNFYKGLVKAKNAGATLTYEFTGTTIGLFGIKCKTGTSATYSIDGGAYTGTVTCQGDVSTDVPRVLMLKNDLPEGNHTITITVNEAETIDFRCGYFIVD